MVAPLSTVLALAVELAAGTVLASLERGAAFPVLVGQDVTGAERRTSDLAGTRTLVVVITDRGAAGRMEAWWRAADQRLPRGYKRLSVASIGVPFFVSIDMVRKRARESVPRQFWRDTLIDTHHNLARTLGLPESKVPFVYALDERGCVIAQAHAEVDSPEGQRVWEDLRAADSQAGRCPGSALGRTPP